MKKTIANRINMYVVTFETCKRYEGDWAGIPKMVSAVNDLEMAINEINAVARLHSTKTLGIASSKAQKLEELYAALLEVHGTFRALANELNDAGLRVKHRYPDYMLRKMNALELKTHIEIVAEELSASGSSLEPFGMDSNRINEILQLIVESAAFIGKPRNAIVERKNLTKSLGTKAAEIDRLLLERVDNMVRLFKRSNQDFFNEYFAARKVMNLGVRHQGSPDNSIDGSSSGSFGTVPIEPDEGN